MTETQQAPTKRQPIHDSSQTCLILFFSVPQASVLPFAITKTTKSFTSNT